MSRSANTVASTWPASAFSTGCWRRYESSLDRALRAPRTTMLVMFAVIALNVFLYVIVPKGFFPQQDTGVIRAPSWRTRHLVPGDAAQAERLHQDHPPPILRSLPSVGFTGGGSQRNTGMNIHRAQAAGTAQGQRRCRHQPPAPQAGARFPAPRYSCKRRKISASAPGARIRNTSMRCKATI